MIRFGTLDFGEEERKAIQDIISENDPQLTMGKKVQEFERSFASWIGSKYAVMVNSGTSALIVALEGYNENFSHEPLVTTALTYPADWNALKVTGTKYVIQDVHDDFVMHIDSIEGAYDNYLAVHLLGKPCRVPLTIEDASEAIGSKLNGQRLGSMGLIGTFSFYVAHQITTIEGGMVVTNNQSLYETFKSLRDNGRTCVCSPCTLKTLGKCTQRQTQSKSFERRWETKTSVGYNFKPIEFQGALGLVKMKHIDENCDRRNKIFLRYSEEFKNFIQLENEYIVPIAYPLKVKNPAEAIKNLELAGIECRGMFPSVCTTYRNAYRIEQTHILLPLHHNMTDEDVETVIVEAKKCQ